MISDVELSERIRVTRTRCSRSRSSLLYAGLAFGIALSRFGGPGTWMERGRLRKNVLGFPNRRWAARFRPRLRRRPPGGSAPSDSPTAERRQAWPSTAPRQGPQAVSRGGLAEVNSREEVLIAQRERGIRRCSCRWLPERTWHRGFVEERGGRELLMWPLSAIRSF